MCLIYWTKKAVSHTRLKVAPMKFGAARFFKATREKRFGCKLEDFCPPDQVETHRQGLYNAFKPISQMLEAEKGTFLMGDKPICAFCHRPFYKLICVKMATLSSLHILLGLFEVSPARSFAPLTLS
jgi:hypothetical protein